MTVGHLLFAGSLTAYMMLAAIVEERDSVNHFGQSYQDYRRRVPMFVPRFKVAAIVFQASRDSEPVAQLAESDACEIAFNRLGRADVPLKQVIGAA